MGQVYKERYSSDIHKESSQNCILNLIVALSGFVCEKPHNYEVRIDMG